MQHPFFEYETDGPDGRKQYMLSFLRPGQTTQCHGLPAESVIAVSAQSMTSPGGFLSFTGNLAFKRLVHQVVSRAGPLDAGLRESARGQEGQWVYIIDLRTRDGPQGRVPKQDVIGAFQVRDGSVSTESYQEMPSYRVVTGDGVTCLPPTLHEALMAAIVGGTSAPPLPEP